MFKNARSANSHSPFPVSLQRRQPFFTFFPFYRFLSTAPALFLPFSLFTVSFQRRQPFLPFSLFTVSFQQRQPFFYLFPFLPFPFNGASPFLPFYPFTFLPLNIFHHFLQPVYCVRQILSEAVVCEQIMVVSGREGRVEGCVHFFDILRDGIFYIVLLPIHGRMFIHAPFLMEKAERLFHAVFRYLLRVFCAHDSLFFLVFPCKITHNLSNPFILPFVFILPRASFLL